MRGDRQIGRRRRVMPLGPVLPAGSR